MPTPPRSVRTHSKCDRNERSASCRVQARRFSMPNTQQHGGTDEDSCIGIVRGRPSWHGLDGASASRGTGHVIAPDHHRSRLALRPGLAHQPLGSLRPQSPIPPAISLLGPAALPWTSPSLAAPSLPAPPPRSPPSSRASLVIGPHAIPRLVQRGGFSFDNVSRDTRRREPA